MTIRVEAPQWRGRRGTSAVRKAPIAVARADAARQAIAAVREGLTAVGKGLGLPVARFRSAEPSLPAPASLRTVRPVGYVGTTRALRPGTRKAAPATAAWTPPQHVPDAALRPTRRWPSRVALPGLALAVGLAVTGLIVANPDGPDLPFTEDALSMRLPYVPSELPDAIPGDWANGLPSPAMPWVVPIEQIAREEGLDPRLLASVVWVESNFNPKAVSPKGAIGIAQVMPETAKELGIRIKDPLENLAGGAHYLRINIQRFGRVDYALAAYNGGPTRMADAKTLARLSDPDIRTYVKDVLQTYQGLGGPPTAANPTS